MSRENLLDDLMNFLSQRVRMKLPQLLQGVHQVPPRKWRCVQCRPCVHEKGKRDDASVFAPNVEEMNAQPIDLIRVSPIVLTHAFRRSGQLVVEKLKSLCFQGILVNFSASACAAG
jgi:hypothetical protein